MKKFVTAIMATICICCISCETSESNQPDLNNAIDSETVNESQTRGGNFAYPNNQMVVQYDPGLSEAEKQQLRAQYGVMEIKTCPCADPTLELWIFETQLPGGSGPNIEDRVIVAKEEDDLEGADFNPIFQHDGLKLGTSFGPADISLGMGAMVSSNTNVTIAVLDTGVDYNYFGFSNPFLYNTQQNSQTCTDQGMEDYFGWDFVNQDNDPYDDYGHGTIVSEFINASLEEFNVPHQILPVKVFNEYGKGNYFDILCGFKYAVNNEDVDIINMSFGWYHSNYDLLGRFVEEAGEDVLIAASAGNQGSNNDLFVHYPSSYPVDNIIAVAALGANAPFSVSLANYSNYGVQSVDIAAKGTDIRFHLDPNEFILVSGTSYASSFTSAMAGMVYAPNMTVAEHVDKVIAETLYHPDLNLIKYSSYINY